jgi:hypothetical protein
MIGLIVSFHDRFDPTSRRPQQKKGAATLND